MQTKILLAIAAIAIFVIVGAILYVTNNQEPVQNPVSSLTSQTTTNVVSSTQVITTSNEITIAGNQ